MVTEIHDLIKLIIYILIYSIYVNIYCNNDYIF